MSAVLDVEEAQRSRIRLPFMPWQRRRKFNSELMVKAVDVAMHPDRLTHIPARDQEMVKMAASAVSRAASIKPLGNRNFFRGGGVERVSGPQPINVAQLAQEAARALAPSAGTTPSDIEVALRRQGIDWVEPFAPGRPLTPYYGYNRRLRQADYKVGRNITTDTRPERIPFAMLKQLNEGYDIASICIRHIIQDMRAMKLSFGPMDDYDGDVSKEINEARRFLRRPDGNRPFVIWLAQWMMDILRYDAGTLYRERNAAGKLIALKVIQGTTIAPIQDYFGDRPIPPAPFIQQFVQGIPWDWATTDDVVYEPHWPLPESPYGVAPIETIVLNANTDVRLQLFFLEFFTAGTVPEMLVEAPPDMSDVDGLAEIQEDWDDFYQNNQKGRHGVHWVPSGSKPHPYKPDKFDPNLAEYVMRRSVAAFGLVPQDLGFTETVNRATADAQADTQFRISTLPNTEIYEAILNMIVQDDLGLPVQVSFDTGREKKDRLMEAQAHQIYVGIGAESPDEVRDDVLGLPVDNDNRIPRFYDSPRLGPVPLLWIQSVSGKIDPATLSPFETPPAQPFVPIAGQKENIPPQQPEDEPTGSKEPAPKKPAQPALPAPTSSAEEPIQEAGVAMPKGAVARQPRQKADDVHEQVGDMHTDPEGRIQNGHHGVPTVRLEGAPARNPFRVDDGSSFQERESRPHGGSSPSRPPSAQMGQSPSTRGDQRGARRAAKEATGGITSATTIAGIGREDDDDEDDDDARGMTGTVGSMKTLADRDHLGPPPTIDQLPEMLKELGRWRSMAKKKAKDKKKQRRFDSDLIPPDLHQYIHDKLMGATTREEVDKVFESALGRLPANPKKEPLDVHRINALALRAGNTGRVLMLQRAMVADDPAAGMWEFPGGHKGFNETDAQGAVREWQEETGIKLPKKAQPFSSWDSFNGRYTGWVWEIPTEDDVELDGREEVKNPDGDIFEAIAWFKPEDLANHPGIRPELKADIASVQSALRWPRKKNMIGIE